jgi:hypothetical protein
MPGRKLLIIMNFGEFGADPPADLRLVIGDSGIDWPLVGAVPNTGFGMDLFESVEIPIDDSVSVFALLDPTETPDADADLRTIELG